MSYEVKIVIEFTTACMGNDRREDPEPNRMLKSGLGAVVFLQTWWHGCTSAAANRFGMHQKQVFQVNWSPEVRGPLSVVERHYQASSTRCVKAHEAFKPQTRVQVTALIPDDIPLDDFVSILKIAGEFYGISPYGWRRGYGRFIVVEAEQTGGKKHNTEGQGKHDGCVSDDAGGI